MFLFVIPSLQDCYEILSEVIYQQTLYMTSYAMYLLLLYVENHTIVKTSFAGTARTSLVITIGPSPRHRGETSSTIMFGQRVSLNLLIQILI